MKCSTVTSFRKDFPIWAIPKGIFRDIDCWTFRNWTNMAWAVSGRRYTALSPKLPFGIAQMGKSFRNEVTVEHFIFRSCEFEQMEMEYFVEPGKQKEALEYWKNERMSWYLRYANSKEKFRLRQHTAKELAHYADDCYDVEYEYPWGWGELEGIASRTDYDLKKHSEHSGVPLTFFEQERVDPATGKKG